MSDSLAAPWIAARQAPLAMGFSRPNTRMGYCALLQGIFPTQGSDSIFLHWQVGSLPLAPPGKIKEIRPIHFFFREKHFLTDVV